MSSSFNLVRGGRGGGLDEIENYQERTAEYADRGAKERDPLYTVDDYQQRTGDFEGRGKRDTSDSVDAERREGGEAVAALAAPVVGAEGGADAVVRVDDYQQRTGASDRQGVVDPVTPPPSTKGRKWETRGDLLYLSVVLPPGAKDAWAEDSRGFWREVRQNEVREAFARAEFKANTAKVEEFRPRNTIPERGELGLVPRKENGKLYSDKAMERWAGKRFAEFEQTDTCEALRAGGLQVKWEIERDARGVPSTLVYRAQSKAEWMAESTVAFNFHLGLSNHLTPDEAVDAMERVQHKYFAENGLYSKGALHWKDGNHHWHGLANLRPIQEDGTFAKGRHPDFRDRRKLGEFEREMRKFAAEVQNEILAAKGSEHRVEWRSDEELGIKRDPKLRGRVVEGEERFDPRKRERLAQALSDPDAVRAELFTKHAVFTREQVRDSMCPSDASAEEVDLALSKVMDVPEVVEVGTDGQGHTMYSSKGQIDLEDRGAVAFAKLAESRPISIPAEKVEEVLARKPFRGLSDEQKDAIRRACRGEGLTCIVGSPGVGKTRMLRALKAVLEESGYRVQIISNGGNQAKKGGKETGLEARTNKSFLLTLDQIADIKTMLATGLLTDRERANLQANIDKERAAGGDPRWIKEKEDLLRSGRLTKKHADYLQGRLEKLGEGLTERDVVIMDEAGQTNFRDGVAISEHIAAAGAAFIPQGDPDQQRSMEGGEWFRAGIEQEPDAVAELRTVRRQQHDVLDCIMWRDGCDLATAAENAKTLTDAEKAEMRAAWMDRAIDCAMFAEGMTVREAFDHVATLPPETKEALLTYYNDDAPPRAPGWQASAVMKMAKGEVAEGLKDFQRGEAFKWTDSRDEAIVEMVADIKADLDAGRVTEREIVAVANANVDVQAINRTLRAALATDRPAPPKPGIEIKTLDNNGKPAGTEKFDIGDRIRFLRNENTGKLVTNLDPDDIDVGVKNGERGFIRDFTDDGKIIVAVDPIGDEEPRMVAVDPAYRNLSLGHALNADVAQGESQSGAYRYIDKTGNQAKELVGLSRGERITRIYADRDNFPDDGALLRMVDRVANKANARDYLAQQNPEERAASERVAAYAKARATSAVLFREVYTDSGRSEVWNHPRWGEYEASLEAVKEHAAGIAADYDTHKKALYREKIGRVSLEVDAGLRPRTLSVAEEAVLEKMQAYAAEAHKSRDWWNRLKAESCDSTVLAATHPEYAAYDAHRAERDAMAAEIVKQPSFRKFTKQVEVPANTVLAHAKAHAERQAEATRVAGLTSAERRIHDTVSKYRDARQATDVLRQQINLQRELLAPLTPTKVIHGEGQDGEKAPRQSGLVEFEPGEAPPDLYHLPTVSLGGLEEGADRALLLLPDDEDHDLHADEVDGDPGLRRPGPGAVDPEAERREVADLVMSELAPEELAITPDEVIDAAVERLLEERAQQRATEAAEAQRIADEIAAAQARDAAVLQDHYRMIEETEALRAAAAERAELADLRAVVLGGLSPDELAEISEEREAELVAELRAMRASRKPPSIRDRLTDDEFYSFAQIVLADLSPVDALTIAPDELERAVGSIVADHDAALAELSRLEAEMEGAMRRRDALAAKVTGLGDGAGAAVINAELNAQNVNSEAVATQAARHETTTLVERYQEAKAKKLTTAATKFAYQIMQGVEAEVGSAKITAGAVQKAGLDWSALRREADTFAMTQAPKEIQQAVQAVRAWTDASSAKKPHAPVRMAAGEHGPPPPPSEEYVSAQRAEDAAAWAVAQAPGWREGIEFWNGRRKFPLDAAKVEQAAERHAARLEVAAWRKAQAEGDPKAAELATTILGQARGEGAEGPRPWSSAVRDAGKPWGELEADARIHALATSPAAEQDARASALAYFDAVTATRKAEDKTVAWRAVDEAAADLAGKNGWKDAVAFWDEHRAIQFPEFKPTDLERVERAAVQHQARDQVAAWNKTLADGDAVKAGQMASEILAHTDAERAAGKEAHRPFAMAVSSANAWDGLRRSADDAAIIGAGELAPALRVARDWLDARSSAARVQSQIAEAEGVEFSKAGDKPEAVAAWRKVDKAAADLVAQNGWKDAVAFWDEHRAKYKEKAKPTNTGALERAAASHLRRERVEAEERAIAEAPPRLQFAIPAVKDYLAARADAFATQKRIAAANGTDMKGARNALEVRDAKKQVRAAAAAVAVFPAGEEALTWLQELRGKKPTPEILRRDAAESHAAIQVAEMVDATGAERMEIARRLIQQMDAERQAGAQPTAQALYEAGIKPGDLRQEVAAAAQAERECVMTL